MDKEKIMINSIKEMMYSTNLTFNKRCELNDIIFKYDEERAKSPEDILRAGKEWSYRLNKLCDYLANN